MSGSPIIQDWKRVVAVPYVPVNDSTRGYGIFIENMLDAAEQSKDMGNCSYLFSSLYAIMYSAKLVRGGCL